MVLSPQLKPTFFSVVLFFFIIIGYLPPDFRHNACETTMKSLQ
jgi:hypothetical protein